MTHRTVTLTTAVAGSTIAAASDAVNLDWFGGKPTSVALSFSSSVMTSDVKLQYTLDDLQRVPSTLVVWNTLPVVSSVSSVSLHLASTTSFDTGYMVSFLNPLGGIKAVSTALSSGTVYVKILQGEGG